MDEKAKGNQPMTVTRNFWDGLAIALVASLPLWVAIIATVRGLLALVL